jgi:hypothetical protein
LTHVFDFTQGRQVTPPREKLDKPLSDNHSYRLSQRPTLTTLLSVVLAPGVTGAECHARASRPCFPGSTTGSQPSAVPSLNTFLSCASRRVYSAPPLIAKESRYAPDCGDFDNSQVANRHLNDGFDANILLNKMLNNL